VLPSQHPRLSPFGFGLGNHAFLLIEHRQAGVREDVVRIDFRNALRQGNGLVVEFQILEGAGEPATPFCN
jgi:hypothetical protein